MKKKGMAKKRPEMKLEQGSDHISGITNDILVFILSFLTLEQAARTTVLSKRWVDVWLSTPRLCFDSDRIWTWAEGLQLARYRSLLSRTMRRKYINWLNQVLEAHRAVALEAFRIRFDLDSDSTPDIDDWLRYAFSRKVQHLDLDLSKADCIPYNLYDEIYFLSLPGGIHVRYSFPDDVLWLSTGFPYDPLVAFKPLKSLALKEVNVTGEVLGFFLSNCPLLESLAVEGSQTLETLEVSGPSLALKHLVIVRCFSLETLIIRDANLVSLRYSTIDGSHLYSSLVIKNVPKLMDVAIVWFALDFSVFCISSFLCSCVNVEVLTFKIDSDALKDEDDNMIAPLPYLPNLKHLEVAVWGLRDESLMEFALLIRASPNLEKFIMKSKRPKKVPSVRRPSKKGKAFPLKNLKVVEIWGYFGRVAEIEFVEYFVENAAALERVVVDPRDQPSGYNLHDTPVENPEDDAFYRNMANLDLQPLLPPHVELVVL